MTPTPTDWALFRKKLPGWQKAYMEQLLQQYMNILKCDRSPEDKFWTLEKRLRRDRQSPGVILEISRSRMELNLIALINDQVISLDDLKDFSDELRERIAIITRNLYQD